LAVFYSCRVGVLQACETLRVGPPSRIADQGLFWAKSAIGRPDRVPKTSEGRGSATRLISLKRDRGGQKSRGYGFSSDPRGCHLNVQIFPGKGLDKYEGRVYPSRTCLPSAGLRSESLTPTSLILRRSFSNSRNRWWTYSRTRSWSST